MQSADSPRDQTHFWRTLTIRTSIYFSVEGEFESSKKPQRRHNFADTPSEICQCNQDIKDTCHFIFECPRYAAQGRT